MLALSKTHIDLGNLPVNIKKEFEVEITNNGSVDVMPHMDVSCGCTIPRIEPSVIRAGESAILKASFDTTGKRGFQSKSVWIKFVENDKPVTITLNFKANVG